MIVNRPLAARLCVLAALVALYFSSEWWALRASTGAAAAFLLSLFGYAAHLVTHGNAVFLTVGDSRYLITPACTYVDLALILMPFTWRIDRPAAKNLARTALLAPALLLLNVGRLALAATLHDGGAVWRLSHDLPDFALYYAAIAVAVLLCARSDWRWLGAEEGGSIPGNA